MLQKKTTLVFEHSPPLPFAYSSSTSTYTVCLGCGTAHEVRYCDGRTIPQWKLCTHHQIMYDRLSSLSQADEESETLTKLTFRDEFCHDNEMLQFLRECVYDGSIPKPPPQPMPKAKPVPPSMYPTPPASNVSTAASTPSTASPNPGTPDPGQKPVLQQLAAEEIIRPKRVFKVQSVHVLWPNPTRSYAHSSSCTSNRDAVFTNQLHLTSDSVFQPPTIRLISSPSLFCKLERRQLTKIADLRRESWRRWNETGTFDEDLENKIVRMRTELTASRLAKGVFFRRCGGVYVNALGWVWEDDDSGGITEDGDRGDLQRSLPKEIDCAVTDDANDAIRTAETDGGDNTATEKIKRAQCDKNISHQHFENDWTGDQNGAVHMQHQSEHPPSRSHIWEPGTQSESDRTSVPVQGTVSPTRYLARLSLTYNSSQHDDEDLIVTCWAWSQPSR